MDTLKRAALVAAMTILLRLAIVGLSRHAGSPIWLVSVSGFFFLPALELLTLLLAIVPSMTLWEKRDAVTHIGMYMLLIVVINAILRIADLVRLNETCESLDFYQYETFCEEVVMQSFCNIPFALIGALVLLVWKLRE